MVPHTHLPFAQVSAALPQVTHAAPAVPHVWTETIMHVLFWQHPLGQLVALHTQVPLTHAWPALQQVALL